MADDRLNIFELLENIDKQNINYFKNLSDREKKQFVPVVVMQWLSCTSDPSQIVLLNEIVNKRIFSLYKHPELMYYLMTTCTSGSKKFYKWKKPTKRNVKYPKSVEVIKEALEYSTKRAMESLPMLSNDDILDIARDLGYQQDKLKELTKELKVR